MTIRKIVVGELSTNCYLLGEATGKGVIIDPGDEAGAIGAALAQNRIKPEAILLTHGHYDHVGGLPGWRLPVYMHKQDVFMLAAAGLEAANMDLNLIDQEGPLTAGPFEFEVIHTPGHSPGSVCLRYGEFLFSGDTLFRRGVGRSDLPGGSQEQIERSLRKLFRLDNEMVVYPGHGPETTIGREKAESGIL